MSQFGTEGFNDSGSSLTPLTDPSWSASGNVDPSDINMGPPLSTPPEGQLTPAQIQSAGGGLDSYLNSPHVSTQPTSGAEGGDINLANLIDNNAFSTALASGIGLVFPTTHKPSAGYATAGTVPSTPQYLLIIVILALVGFFTFRALRK